LQEFVQALPKIHAIVGRYLDGQDSLDDAATSLAGVLRRIREHEPQAPTPPRIPITGVQLRKLTPEQWSNDMILKGTTIEGFSIAPGPFSPERSAQAHVLLNAALELLNDAGAA